jgi:hypothetical protein
MRISGENRCISFTDCNGALRAVALGVCDYLTELTNCSVKGASIPLEGSIVPIVSDMFMEGADRHRLISGVEPALLATTGAWAVFGAARMWHQTPNRIPAEEMAAKIEAMVKPIFLNSFGYNSTTEPVAPRRKSLSVAKEKRRAIHGGRSVADRLAQRVKRSQASARADIRSTCDFSLEVSRHAGRAHGLGATDHHLRRTDVESARHDRHPRGHHPGCI